SRITCTTPRCSYSARMAGVSSTEPLSVTMTRSTPAWRWKSRLDRSTSASSRTSSVNTIITPSPRRAYPAAMRPERAHDGTLQPPGSAACTSACADAAVTPATPPPRCGRAPPSRPPGCRGRGARALAPSQPCPAERAARRPGAAARAPCAARRRRPAGDHAVALPPRGADDDGRTLDVAPHLKRRHEAERAGNAVPQGAVADDDERQAARRLDELEHALLLREATDVEDVRRLVGLGHHLRDVDAGRHDRDVAGAELARGRRQR